MNVHPRAVPGATVNGVVYLHRFPIALLYREVVVLKRAGQPVDWASVGQRLELIRQGTR